MVIELLRDVVWGSLYDYNEYNDQPKTVRVSIWMSELGLGLGLYFS